MADGVDDEDGGWLVHPEDSDDLWEPCDDPDYWDDATGERAYQGNETALRWRIVTPSGIRIAHQGDGSEFKTRSEALTYAAAPHMPMKRKTFERLLELTVAVAGWAKITADGWTIEPIPEKKSDG